MSFLARSGDRQTPSEDSRPVLLRIAGFKLSLLDFTIALGRKIGGFCALLTLGWTYFRILFLGHSLHQLYPDAADPDLRQTLWVGLLLIMAQGWDIPIDRIEGFWTAVRAHMPPRTDRPLPRPTLISAAWTACESIFVRLGRFMDLCVAIANKIGAFAVLCYLIFLAEEFWLRGVSVGDMYPAAADPHVSLLADLCVYVVVLGWWATPFEQIRMFWVRLRQPVSSAATEERQAGSPPAR